MEATSTEENKPSEVINGLNQCMLILEDLGFVLKEYCKKNTSDPIYSAGFHVTLRCPVCNVVLVLAKPTAECTCCCASTLSDISEGKILNNSREEQLNKSLQPNTIVKPSIKVSIPRLALLSPKASDASASFEIDPPVDKSSPLPQNSDIKKCLSQAIGCLENAMRLMGDETYTKERKASIKKRISDIKSTPKVVVTKKTPTPTVTPKRSITPKTTPTPKKTPKTSVRNVSEAQSVPSKIGVKRKGIPVLNSIERKRVMPARGLLQVNTPITKTAPKTRGIAKLKAAPKAASKTAKATPKELQTPKRA